MKQDSGHGGNQNREARMRYVMQVGFCLPDSVSASEKNCIQTEIRQTSSDNMKPVILIFLMSAALAVSAQTNQAVHQHHARTGTVSDFNPTNQDLCCRYPLRRFGSAANVNLTPLFKWWSHHALDDVAGTAAGATEGRPLAAWHRITGHHVGDADSSWVVEAEIYTNPGVRLQERILLKNPPIAEEQLFYGLKSELAATVQQMTNDQRLYQADTKAAQKAEARANKPVRNTRSAKNQASQNAQTASQDQQAAAAALSDQQELAQALPLAQKRLNAIPAKDGKYMLDCFALAAGKTKAGVPIYDLGVVDINSP